MFSGCKLPKYNADQIINSLDQKLLFSTYLGIYPDFRKKYYSPFRIDKNPGCSFKEQSGIIWFVENTGFNGKIFWSIFDVIQYLHGCTFDEALEIITNDFTIKTIKEQYVKIPEIPFRIKFKSKQWNENNIFELSPQILEKEQVFLVDDYWTGKSELYQNNIHNPKKTLTIAYFFPDSGNVKLYFPEQKEYRFVTNCTNNDIYGNFKLDYYEKKDNSHLVITKSQKDRLVLDYHLGYNTIAIQTEHVLLSESYMDMLKSRFEKIIVFFDNDGTGKKRAHIYKNKYQTETYFLKETKDIYEAFKQKNDEYKNKII